MKISAVVPCYNEEEALSFFYEEMLQVMDQMSSVEFELVCGNDG